MHHTSEPPHSQNKTLLNLKEQIGPDTILTGELNTPLSLIDRTCRQKMNKDILELKNTMDEMDLTDSRLHIFLRSP
jgi:hypothetical protein